VQKVSRTFSKNNLLLKSYGRIPIEFGTKRDKFQFKWTNFLLENDQTNFKSCGTNLRLKSQPQLNTHNKKCLLKISNKKT